MKVLTFVLEVETLFEIATIFVESTRTALLSNCELSHDTVSMDSENKSQQFRGTL